MTGFSRFELLLPLEFNDGRPIPRQLLADAALEIEHRFQAVSWESQVIEPKFRN